MPYIDELQTFRTNAGLRVSELADKAGLDRATIKRVEKHNNCRHETLIKIVNALNDLYYHRTSRLLNAQAIITETSRFG